MSSVRGLGERRKDALPRSGGTLLDVVVQLLTLKQRALYSQPSEATATNKNRI